MPSLHFPSGLRRISQGLHDFPQKLASFTIQFLMQIFRIPIFLTVIHPLVKAHHPIGFMWLVRTSPLWLSFPFIFNSYILCGSTLKVQFFYQKRTVVNVIYFSFSLFTFIFSCSFTRIWFSTPPSVFVPIFRTLHFTIFYQKYFLWLIQKLYACAFYFL